MVLPSKEAHHLQKLFSGKDHPKWVKAIQRLHHSGVTMRNQFLMELSSNHLVTAGSYQPPQLLRRMLIAYTDSHTTQDIIRMVHLGSFSG